MRGHGKKVGRVTTAAVSSRRAATQDKLIDAAVSAFAEKGVLGASVEEICERAGFTRGAFYSNFDSKDELCIAVLERKGHEMLHAATQATAQVPGEPIELRSVDDVIRRAVTVFQAGHPHEREWMMARSELQLYALRNPSIREPLQLVERSLAELLSQAITSAVERQGATLRVPTEMLLTLLEGYYEALSMRALMEDRSQDDPRWAEQLATLVRILIYFPGDDT